MSAYFCAVCVSDIDHEPTREPIGKNGGLVAVCGDCATRAANPGRQQRRVISKMPAAPRYVAIKANRDRLTAAGLCYYGANHGPAKHGRLCETCWGKRSGQAETR